MDETGRYLVHLRVRGLRPNTIAQAERVLGWLERHLDRAAITATSADLESYLATKPQDSTRAVEWSYLSGFYRWAVAWDLLERNPLDRIPRPRVPRKRPRPMPAAMVARTLTESPARLRPWFYLAAFAGLRACDIAPLRAEHVEWDAARLIVPETKGGDEVARPIAPELGRVLAALPREGWLFPRLDGRPGHVSAHLISELTGRWLRSVGIPHSFHTLRHAYATRALALCDGNLRVVQELLGHEKVTSTQVYADVEWGQMVTTVAGLRWTA